jgi:hypothetical protein
MGRMPPRSALLALAVAGACLVVPARAAAASTSSNWAGYISHLNGTRFRTVRGAWTVPAVDCSAAPRGYSANWIGLGGYHTSSAALEQTGTESDCENGKASYEAWYELVPDQEATIKMTVKPGDQISSRVTVNGSDVTVRLSDLTTGATFNKVLVASAIDTTSAEWIVEAPSECLGTTGDSCRVLPLANFTTTSFTAARAVSTTGHEGVINDAAWAVTPINLSSDASPFGGRFRGGPRRDDASGNATVGALTTSGASFTVTYAPSPA